MRVKKIKKGKAKDIYDILYSFVKKVHYDHVSSFAGHAALFILMSLFPMVMYCIAIFSYLPFDTGQFSQFLFSIIPEELTPLLGQILAEAYEESTTMMKSFTMLVMLFCASKGVYAIIIGMNAVYGIRESRNTPFLYALAVVYMLIFFAMLGLTMILIVLGNTLFDWLLKFLPGLSVFHSIFKYGKYPCMLVLLILFFLLLYMNIPNRKSKIRYEFPGAVFSTVVWLVFSWAFSFYISHFANYSVTYGSLATIVVFILWLYGTMNIVFIGAEMNVVLRKYAEYGYNYKYAYEYFDEKYHGDLQKKSDLALKFSNMRKREKDHSVKKEEDAANDVHVLR